MNVLGDNLCEAFSSLFVRSVISDVLIEGVEGVRSGRG